MKLLRGEHVIWRGQPSPRSSVTFFARWGTLSIVPAVVATVLWARGAPTGPSVGDWWVASIVLVVLVIIRNTLVRHAMRFTVTNLRIIVRHGILSRVEQTTAIARIQNITTRQSIVQRLLGIGDVEFDTAGGDLPEADFRFVGVANPGEIVRRIDYGVRETHRDAWATGL
jgi:uncharacterized membrane protein YdbT with pleckstrin-like domain